MPVRFYRLLDICGKWHAVDAIWNQCLPISDFRHLYVLGPISRAPPTDSIGCNPARFAVHICFYCFGSRWIVDGLVYPDHLCACIRYGRGSSHVALAVVVRASMRAKLCLASRRRHGKAGADLVGPKNASFPAVNARRACPGSPCGSSRETGAIRRVGP